ncbi:hypothetical protein Droror1_Dr00010106 [Drosera rotundifolia]
MGTWHSRLSEKHHIPPLCESECVSEACGGKRVRKVKPRSQREDVMRCTQEKLFSFKKKKKQFTLTTTKATRAIKGDSFSSFWAHLWSKMGQHSSSSNQEKIKQTVKEREREKKGIFY